MNQENLSKEISKEMDFEEVDFWKNFNKLEEEKIKLDKELTKYINFNSFSIINKKRTNEKIQKIIEILGQENIIRKSFGLIHRLNNLKRSLNFIEKHILRKISHSINLNNKGYSLYQFHNLLHKEHEYEKKITNQGSDLIDELISTLEKEKRILKLSLKKEDKEFIYLIEGYIKRNSSEEIKNFKKKLNRIGEEAEKRLSEEEAYINKHNDIYKYVFIGTGLFLITIELMTKATNNPKLDDGKGFGYLLGAMIISLSFNKKIRDSIIDNIKLLYREITK